MSKPICICSLLPVSSVHPLPPHTPTTPPKTLSLSKQVRGDGSARARLTARLAADEEGVVRFLSARNQWDLQLYAYAQTLAAERLRLIPGLVGGVKGVGAVVAVGAVKGVGGVGGVEGAGGIPLCGPLLIPPSLRRQWGRWVGIFQPPKHKGPL
ncbi:hypothetical protein B484DRAFT_458710 [Ochromonadaceae sp. CCMP2298]|nr:hypothetical protein B484DRAFT_458710 [Ochromonadaceae sp. CCMP2298]